MSAYIRCIIGDEGKVLKIAENSLYHPNEDIKDHIEELLTYGGAALEFLAEEYNDSEVLVIFHLHTYPCHHPLDPVEYETELVIEHCIILQGGYKEYRRKTIERYLEVYNGCSHPLDRTQDVIAEWEELYDEDFVLKERIVDTEDDPFSIYKQDWDNAYLV